MAMNVQVRGGVPRVRPYAAIDDSGTVVGFRGVSNFLEIRNEGSDELRVYFHLEDFTVANGNYIPVAAGETFSGPIEKDQIWLATAVGDTTDARVLIYYTR